MATINLKGYNINFPYPTPYDIQKHYMEKVLTCLDQKTHAVLESPTGTGKTLCLFAPVTAWAREKKCQRVQYVINNSNSEFNGEHSKQSNDQTEKWGSKSKSKIWYTARTHSQIAQTVSEVRKCHTDDLHIRVMGARDQLCINKLVIDEKDSYVKTVKCKEMVKNKQCKYFNKLNYEKDFNKYYQKGEVLDIEDLVSVGRAGGVCPYFLAKKAAESADIILLPYNYILDKESRESNNLYLQNDVVIFDEGHNIPSSCEESYEFSFNSLDIAISIKNIKELMITLTKLTDSLTEEEEIDIAAHASNSLLIMTVLQKLESGLSNLPTSNELLPITYIYNFFDDAGISEATSRQIVEGIHLFKNDSTQLNLTSSCLETFKLLEKMMNVIFGPSVRSFDVATIERSFKCGITVDPERHNVKKLSLFCFNPSFGIKSLIQLGVQSIIITSGTLSPLKTFISELGLINPVTLENSHIAKKCQVPFIILGTGINNVRMDGAYKNRNDPKYVSSLGMTLTNLISSVPDGILLLFSSYTMMQNLKDAWETDLGIWTRLNALKRVFVEPRNKEEFINCMENYRRAIDAGNGAILMGVLRGKISEGMDFKDQYCRGVFIIGVPFPPIQDPRVQGKEKYAESLTIFNPITKSEEKLYNNSFMAVEAMKATNQAIGRVIRHGNDYGVIVLMDYRFAWPRLFQNISCWLRDDTPIEKNFQTTKKFMRDFFRDIHLGKLGVEEIVCQRVDSNGCPIAGYVSFEEYDHKKFASQPVAWIGGSQQEAKGSRSVTNNRGHSTVAFVDSDNSKELMSMYKQVGMNVSQSVINSQNSGSLLDVLEKSRNTSIGYREFDECGFEEPTSKIKRKYEEDMSHDSSPPSPSMLSFPHSSQKKFPKLKVKPPGPFQFEDTELKVGTSKSEEKAEEDLKVKLINYYKLVKQSLSADQDRRFKTISCKYMKGEVSLTDIVDLMDEIFLVPQNKNLFAGFGICVKSKDKQQWSKTCKARNIECH